MVNATICPEDKTNADPAGKERINAEEPEIKGRPCGKGYDARRACRSGRGFAPDHQRHTKSVLKSSLNKSHRV